MTSKLLVIVPALLLGASASAQQYEKNGQPCVAELCIGDGLAEIANVKWDKAVSGFRVNNQYPPIAGLKVDERDLQRLRKTFPEANATSAPYLRANKFDNAALASLGKLTVQCVNDDLVGSYTTESGNPTLVRISLVPGAQDSTKQAWAVSGISRKFPAAVTKEQIAEVRAQLQQRYHAHGLWNHSLRNPKPGEARAQIQGYNDIALHLNSFHGSEVANRRKQHPQCGGSAKVKID